MSTGDVTVLENVGVAAPIAAGVGGVSVAPVTVLARVVDRDNRTRTVSEGGQGPVTSSRN